jgi:hypothetical protein
VKATEVIVIASKAVKTFIWLLAQVRMEGVGDTGMRLTAFYGGRKEALYT